MLYEQRQQQASPYDTAEQKAFFSPDEVAKSNFWIYRDKYLITAVKSGLMIIDRQLALERITYEQILLRLQQGQKATQTLLFTETITFSADDTTRARSNGVRYRQTVGTVVYNSGYSVFPDRSGQCPRFA